MSDAGSARISAVDLAAAIGLPRPTDEQAAVIESPMEPSLVVAGAGSGKTETMASRVLWLLANGRVGVPGILGLTFTRKAAGELGKRIGERIAQLEAAGLLPGEFDPFDAPTITTYNAFANTVFRDNALLVGREAEATVLGEPSAWQLARGLVARSLDDRLAQLGKSPDALTQAVLDLGRAMGEHVAAPDAVRAEAERFAGLLDLPAGKRTPYASVLAAVESVSALPPLVDLAVAFAELKEQRGLVEFSDQVALALQVVEGSPQVARDLRERFPVVLLDEYQDTSVVQTRLLAGLFRGAAVMGVGDPHQSIYGFRGASAANLGRFLVDFAAPPAARGEGPGPVGRYALATSWRNAESVLAAANALVDPLSRASAVPVERLRPARARRPARSSWPTPRPCPRRRMRWRRGSPTPSDPPAARGASRRPRRSCSAPDRPCPPSGPRSRRPGCRTASSDSAGCSPSPRSSTSSAACGCCTIRRPAAPSSACSPVPAGASASPTSPRCATWPAGSSTETTRSAGSTTRCAASCAPRSPRARTARSSTPSTSSRRRPRATAAWPPSARTGCSGCAPSAAS
ncbi:hypothetical protein GCM10025874_30540 [Arenivirga flava]|uniref:UvrD-like helicase ATP-binding domain-containing protein n=1 Tax=Arenivirga flava TaxID=1930060 RepID=A0AA37UMS8_9MICO|nr:hypothetical protein GCM10025874_30540 [Arenivirga flava]